MRILFDHGTPEPLRRALGEHSVRTAYEMGWSMLDNGSLLAAGEREFEVFVTTDQSIRYQQKLTGRRLAILVLPTTSWPRIQGHLPEIIEAMDSLRPGDLLELSFKA